VSPRIGKIIGLEIDFDGVGEPELEIELELPGRTNERPTFGSRELRY